MTQTPSSTTPNIPRLPNTPLSADKSKAHLKDARKRFPSDPSSDGFSVNARKLAKGFCLIYSRNADSTHLKINHIHDTKL